MSQEPIVPFRSGIDFERFLLGGICGQIGNRGQKSHYSDRYESHWIRQAKISLHQPLQLQFKAAVTASGYSYFFSKSGRYAS